MSAYDLAVAADSPVLYHPLDATPADTLLEVGSVTYIGDGPNGGGAAHLATTADYLRIPDPYPAAIRPTTAVTVEIWVRTTANNGQLVSTPVDGGGPYGYSLGVWSTKLQIGSGQGGGSAFQSPGSVNDGAWHHIVGTYTSGARNLYIDGALVGSDARSGNIDYLTSGDWEIAGWHAGAQHSDPLTGDVAAVAVYDYVLDAGRVAAHYTADRSAAAPPVLAAVAFAATGTLTVTAEPDPVTAAVTFTGTGTLTVGPPPDLGVSYASVAFTGTGSLDVIARPVGRRRRLVVVDLDGAPLGELENATCGDLKYPLVDLAVEDWTFTLPLADPKAALLLGPRFREIQLWRGDQLLAWGPAVRVSCDKSHLVVACRGAGWYLSRRSIGDASRRNYLTNGDFEDGLTGWNIGALSPFEPLATRGPEFYIAETATDRVLTGTHSLYLAQVGTGAPKYGVAASQSLIWEVDPATHPEGDQFTFSARCYIPSETWRGPPIDDVGIRLDRFSTTETVTITPEGGGTPVVYPAPIETITAPIDENTPRDVWLPLEAVLVAPVTGDAEFVAVTLSCPDGAIIWDRATLSLDEGLRFHGVDQAAIVAGIVEHLQDPAYGKTYLNLWTDTPATGVIRDRTYLHHEHINGASAIEELTTLADGVDVSVAYTPWSRTVRTHHPARGTYRPQFAIELGRTISDFAWTFDGESAASQVIVLGTGDGSDREEASATADPLGDFAYADGLTLETVFTAPPSTLIDSLDDVAAETLAVSLSPEVLAVTCTSPQPGQADPVGILTVGDFLPVRIRSGALLIDGVYRIVELTLTPDDTLDLTLNKRAPT